VRSDRHLMHQRLHEVERGADPDLLAGLRHRSAGLCKSHLSTTGT
jgi:hypothetical protein